MTSRTSTSDLHPAASNRAPEIEIVWQAFNGGGKHDGVDGYEEMLEFFNRLKDQKFNEWINCTISYAGFDASALRMKVLRAVRIEDIAFLVIVGMMKGNDVSKIIKTMKRKEDRERLTAMVKVLGLSDRVSGKPDAITLSRICASFPEAVAVVHIVTKGNLQMAVSVEELRAKTGLAEYPDCARSQSLLSTVPKELDDLQRRQAASVFLAPYLMMSAIINTKKVGDGCWSKKSNDAKITESIQFMSNVYHSSVLDQDRRIDLSRDLGMVTKQGELALTLAWREASDSAIRWIMGVFGIDPIQKLADAGF